MGAAEGAASFFSDGEADKAEWGGSVSAGSSGDGYNVTNRNARGGAEPVRDDSTIKCVFFC